MQYHNDTIIKTQEDFFIKIYTSHFICNVCVREGVGDRTELQYIDPTLMAVSIVSFSFSKAAQPGGPDAHSAG